MMNRVRVGHFIETKFPGGAEQVMLDLCEYSKDRNIEPIIFHFEHRWIDDQCEELGIEHHVIPFREVFKSNLTLPVFAFKFSRLLKQYRVDLLHNHLFGPIVGGGLAAFLARIPHIGTVHDIYMIEESPKKAPRSMFIGAIRV